MTYNEMRIAIAEACGWTSITDNCYSPSGISGQNKSQGKMGLVWGIPDYVGDLNAMHEAEKTLHGIQTHYYALRLGRIEVPFDAVHSTARQRAEAFLKTIGKWKD